MPAPPDIVSRQGRLLPMPDIGEAFQEMYPVPQRLYIGFQRGNSIFIGQCLGLHGRRFFRIQRSRSLSANARTANRNAAAPTQAEYAAMIVNSASPA
jgi:hypothetical protein